MDSVSFTIPGDPRGKGRHRASIRAGRVHTYTDEKTATYENLVKLAGAEAMAGATPFDCPLAVVMVVRVTPPKSTSKRNRAAMLAGDIQPAKKPDLSNVLKAVEDGLNGVAYRDDCQIVHFVCRKIYAETSGVDVLIQRLRSPA
jgi:Holliday junction resolvase RusA-like endonuclease